MPKERVSFCLGLRPAAGTLSPRSPSTALPFTRSAHSYLPTPSAARSLLAATSPHSLIWRPTRSLKILRFPPRSARRPQNDSSPPQTRWDLSTAPVRTRPSSKCGISSRLARDRAGFRLSFNSTRRPNCQTKAWDTESHTETRSKRPIHFLSLPNSPSTKNCSLCTLAAPASSPCPTPARHSPSPSLQKRAHPGPPLRSSNHRP